MTRLPFSQRTGFSLVEIVLAIAVCSITLVSIMGVLGVAIGSNGNSKDDTTLAAMSRYVQDDLRAVPFDALWTASPREATAPATLTGTAADSLPDTIYLFKSGGLPTTQEAEAVYRCTVHKVPDLKTRGSASGPYHQVRLTLTFHWPVTAAPDHGENTTIYASVARY